MIKKKWGEIMTYDIRIPIGVMIIILIISIAWNIYYTIYTNKQRQLELDRRKEINEMLDFVKPSIHLTSEKLTNN